MSKSKKRKKQTVATVEQREELRRARAEQKAKQNRRGVWAMLALIAGIVLLIALLIAPFAKGDADGYTHSQYRRMETGITYERVVKIMNGETGVLQSAEGSDGAETYLWDDGKGHTITATFEDDKVVSFNQTGFKN